MKRIYLKCVGDYHFFSGESCPYDGWLSKESRELQAIIKKITNDGYNLNDISMELLIEHGLSHNTQQLIIIVEFFDERFIFDSARTNKYDKK